MIKKEQLFDIGLLVLLVIAALHFVWGMGNALDIELFDESFTLHSGIRLCLDGFPAASESPLYSLWYYGLHVLQPDTIKLFYVNSQIVTVLPPLLLFVLLRKYAVNAFIAFLIAYVFLLMVGNAYAIPRIGQFALVLMLLSLIGLRFFNDKVRAYTFVAICALVMAFVRPEYFISYSIFMVLWMMEYVKSFKQASVYGYEALAIVLFPIGLITYFGFPLAGGRSFFAFAQHFALHWTQWTHSTLDPWTHWSEIFGQNFCQATSVIGALRCDPVLFFQHIIVNLLNIFPRLIFLSLPATYFWGLIIVNGVIGLVLVMLLAVFIRHLFQQKTQVLQNILANKNVLIASAVFLLPVFISLILIYPRNHYVVIVLCIGLFVGALLAKHSSKQALSHKQNIGFVIVVLLMFGCFPAFPGQSNIAKPNVQTIQIIRLLKITEPVNMLDAEGGFAIYTGDNVKRVVAFNKEGDFDAFLKANKLNMIVSSALINNEPRFKNDAKWHYFLTHFDQYDFVKIAIPHTDRVLFVQKALLPLSTANNVLLR